MPKPTFGASHNLRLARIRAIVFYDFSQRQTIEAVTDVGVAYHSPIDD